MNSRAETRPLGNARRMKAQICPCCAICTSALFINSAVGPQKPKIFIDVELKERKAEERNWNLGFHSVSLDRTCVPSCSSEVLEAKTL